MSRTIAMHVRYNSLYSSLPSSAKQREMTNSAWSGESEPRRLIFYIFISNWSMCPSFSFMIPLPVINRVNDAGLEAVFGVAAWFLKLPIFNKTRVYTLIQLKGAHSLHFEVILATDAQKRLTFN